MAKRKTIKKLNLNILDDYKEFVRSERKIKMTSPFDLAYNSFIKLGLQNQPISYFEENASQIVSELRRECWNGYIKEEQVFLQDMLKALMEPGYYSKMTPEDSIIDYIERFSDHLYAVNLSNTQSRRTRAGKEFEAIIELILMGADVSFNGQGVVGKNKALEQGIGKSVDVVIPGALQYSLDKTECILISAKTTLRERWAEVVEELNRTGGSEIYLATLDDKITPQTFQTLYEANVRILTTKTNKQLNYSNNPRVKTFEEVIKKCHEKSDWWKQFNYNAAQKSQLVEDFKKQLEKAKTRPFVEAYCKEQIDEIES